jgi:hypothetical protein
MPKPEPSEKLLTSAEACAALGISLTKFYVLTSGGQLAVIRLPSASNRRRELRVEPSEIRAFIERNRQPSRAS